MSNKCVICKKAFVSRPGECCITCKVRQQSYQIEAVGKPNRAENISDSELLKTPISPTVKEVANPVRNVRGKLTYTGIVQNVHQSKNQRSLFARWIDSVIYGSRLTISDTQYEFSLYQQGAYTAERIQGKEIVFYGNPGYCFLNNNSTVTVTGVMNSDGVVIAEEIIGINTHFRMRPKMSISASVIRGITLLAVLFLVGLLIIPFVGNVGSVPEGTNATGTGAMLFSVLCLAGAGLVVKSRIPKRMLIAMVLAILGFWALQPLISILLALVLFLWMKFIAK